MQNNNYVEDNEILFDKRQKCLDKTLFLAEKE